MFGQIGTQGQRFTTEQRKTIKRILKKHDAVSCKGANGALCFSLSDYLQPECARSTSRAIYDELKRAGISA